MRRNQLLAVLVGVAAAVLLFVVLRPDDEDAAGTAPGTTAPPGTVLAPTVEDTTPGGDPATAPETETAVEPPPTTAPEEPGPTTAAITLSGGRPQGGLQRITVEEGERVRIVVRADEPDELHLHGYDITRRVAPNAPAQLIFTADIPGRFELESHHGGGQIAQLEVRP